jgi:hypothetical protein
MPRKQRDIERGLVNKGFQRTESHHHFFVYHSCDGKKTAVKTKTSHGTREVSSYILQQMARQLYLSKIDFLNLIDCPQ